MTDMFGDPAMLRWAMSIQALAVGAIALALLALGIGHYRAAVDELDHMIETSPLR